MLIAALRSLLWSAVVVIGFGAGSGALQAATFVVTSTADIVDANTADGLCKTAGGVCTLRAAIQQADAFGGTNRIEVPRGTYLLNPALGRLTLGNVANVLTIVGTGAPTTGPFTGVDVTYIDGQNATGIFLLGGGTVTLDNLNIQRGRVDVTSPGEFGSCAGAAVYASGDNTTVNITSSYIRLNSSTNGSGGAICIDDAVVNIDRTYVAYNQSTYGGAGIRVFPGISVLNLTNSTVAANQVKADGSTGGGIRAQGNISVTNSTIANNGAPGGGGGLHVAAGTATIRNSTIAANGLNTQVLVGDDEGQLIIESSIVEGNVTCGIISVGTITSLGHNLENRNTCGFTGPGDLINTHSGIQFTEFGGGPTPVFPLPANSVAIGAGSNPLGLAFDQRGFPRVQGASVDIGAYEAEVPERNLSGLWWAFPPGSQSGWGINLQHEGDSIFATWFTYGPDGKPLWLAVFATMTAPGVYSGELFTTVGPPYNAVPFDTNIVAETTVGTATFTVGNDGQLTFDYSLTLGAAANAKALITQTKTLVRQAFGPLPQCTWADGQPSQATNYTALWWNSPAGSESGWGINFTHQGEQIFATWFTYDLAGKPWWLAFLANPTGPRVYQGDVFTTTGPPLNAVPFDPAIVVETTIGAATLTFIDGYSATFSYTIDGATQEKSIQRQQISSPLTLCQ
jgi:CSLREA domain-containing protein